MEKFDYTNHPFNLFSSVSIEEKDALLLQIGVEEQSFEKDSILFLQDDPCNKLIILTEGGVKTEMTDPRGKTFRIEDIYAPNPLAILFVFGQQSKFPVQATTLCKTKALFFSHNQVLGLLSANQTILKNYLNISAFYAKALSSKLYFMSFRTIRQKLIVYLLKQTNTASNTLLLEKSHAVLADFFGVTRPSLTRELQRMKTEGLIEIDGKKIILLDRNQLIRLVKF